MGAGVFFVFLCHGYSFDHTPRALPSFPTHLWEMKHGDGLRGDSTTISQQAFLKRRLERAKLMDKKLEGEGEDSDKG